MDEIKLKGLLKESQEAFGSKVTDDITKGMKSMDDNFKKYKEESKKDFEAELEKWGNNFMTKYEKIPGAVEAITTQLNRMDNDLKNGIGNKSGKSVKARIEEALNGDEFKSFRDLVKNDKGKGEFNFRLKAGDMSESGNLTGEIPLADEEPGVFGKTPYRKTFMQNIIPVGFTTSRSISWVDRSDQNNDAAVRAEAGTYAQSDVDYTRRTLAIKSLATYYKMTDEMLEDVDYVLSEVRSEALGQMERLLDAQMLTGTGSGNNITGIQANATAFSAPTGTALEIDDASNYDAILVAALQGQLGNYVMDTVITHPTDWLLTLLTKDQNGNYITPPFIGGNVFLLGGMRVVANSGQTQGTIDVFDSSKAKLFIRQNILIRLWDQNASDPINGLKTLTAVARANQRISAEHYGAFINGTLAAIKLAINKV